MEAGDYDNPMLLNLEEYSVGEPPHYRTATVPVDNRELQWMVGDCLNRDLDRLRETHPKLRAYVVIPCPRFQQILVRLWYGRPGVSRFLKQSLLDLFPGNDVGRVLLMPSDAVIELCPLRIR